MGKRKVIKAESNPVSLKKPHTRSASQSKLGTSPPSKAALHTEEDMLVDETPQVEKRETNPEGLKEAMNTEDLPGEKTVENRIPIVVSTQHPGLLIESDASEDLLSNSDDECDSPTLVKESKESAHMVEESTDEVLDAYFTAHNKRGTHTSNQTMSGIVLTSKPKEKRKTRLINPLVHDQVTLSSEYCKLFQQWLFQMAQGYNLLLYGVGSKIEILHSFVTQNLPGSLHFTVNGYFPGLTIRQVLKGIAHDLLEHEGTLKTESDLVTFITGYLAEQSTPELLSELFLVIHNIDGPMLQNNKAQELLGHLAASKHVHVLASVDHINAPLLWDQWKCSQFNWIYHNVTNFHPYVNETSYENSMLVKQSGVLVLSSLLHVLKSLTPHSRGIFSLLAKYHMEHQDDNNYLGLSFQELYRKCREQFLVNSDITLRVQLTEFHDHKLVKSQKGPNGLEYLTIPMDKGTLEQYFATLE